MSVQLEICFAEAIMGIGNRWKDRHYNSQRKVKLSTWDRLCVVSVYRMDCFRHTNGTAQFPIYLHFLQPDDTLSHFRGLSRSLLKKKLHHHLSTLALSTSMKFLIYAIATFNFKPHPSKPSPQKRTKRAAASCPIILGNAHLLQSNLSILRDHA